ncbi:MAG: restriction endonuclease [Campylobacter sp.]|nr:restriction endonuclease [Campylobacter sp.]
MSNGDKLRQNLNQHLPKNTKSKQDDKNISIAMQNVIEYLNDRFKDIGNFKGFCIDFEKSLSIKAMIENIRHSNVRKQFDYTYEANAIKPDGGFLILKKIGDENYQKLLLAAEMKRQGTNDKRQKEGKDKQAQGNAIERLGKNLTGIKAMMNHEDITPFLCFGSGCDFADNSTTVPAKISTLNEFYYLNRTYIFKKDGYSDNIKF